MNKKGGELFEARTIYCFGNPALSLMGSCQKSVKK
jgi:hypothetical protein